MRKSTKVVALDIHKDSVALAGEGRKTPKLYGTIPSTGEALSKLVGKLADPKTQLKFCYEAGRCGYGVYRQLTGIGHECTVVAPSLIPDGRATASRPIGGMRCLWRGFSETVN